MGGVYFKVDILFASVFDASEVKQYRIIWVIAFFNFIDGIINSHNLHKSGFAA